MLEEILAGDDTALEKEELGNTTGTSNFGSGKAWLQGTSRGFKGASNATNNSMTRANTSDFRSRGGSSRPLTSRLTSKVLVTPSNQH